MARGAKVVYDGKLFLFEFDVGFGISETGV